MEMAPLGNAVAEARPLRVRILFVNHHAIEMFGQHASADQACRTNAEYDGVFECTHNNPPLFVGMLKAVETWKTSRGEEPADAS